MMGSYFNEVLREGAPSVPLPAKVLLRKVVDAEAKAAADRNT
jgi:hypothetical protein